MLSIISGVSANEALSGIFGSISLTAWICLLLPQLITNYKAKSADGLSMGFLAIWLFGDVSNLAGALVTGIAPTAVALAAYFCFSDVVLISQSLYYKMRSARLARQRAQSTGTQVSEDEPLLGRRRTSSGGVRSGSQRRPSFRREGSFDPITRIVTGEDEDGEAGGNPWLYNSLCIIAVYVVGALGWFASWKMGAWSRPDESNAPSSQEVTAIAGVVLGYLSALCYLCARIPQIIKNYREKSCEGLALLFFLLSLTGNLTYGLSVFSYSQDPDYLTKAIPWMLGSLGTIVEDCIIFGQFRIYAPQRQVKSAGAN